MLVKLSHGTSINKDNLKYITVDVKKVGRTTKYVVTLRVDDNTDHPIVWCESQADAVKVVKDWVTKLKADE